jgi:hypothetical protein
VEKRLYRISLGLDWMPPINLGWKTEREMHRIFGVWILGLVRWIGFSLDSVTTALNVERNYPKKAKMMMVRGN